MTQKFNVFVSSVQKELENERVTVQDLLKSDQVLAFHYTPVLYEYEPASPEIARQGCIEALKGCQLYVLIVGVSYGTLVGEFSITHLEYRRAKEMNLPVLAFIKSVPDLERDKGTNILLKELRADGFKYKNFSNVIELKTEVRAALFNLIPSRVDIARSNDETGIAGSDPTPLGASAKGPGGAHLAPNASGNLPSTTPAGSPGRPRSEPALPVLAQGFPSTRVCLVPLAWFRSCCVWGRSSHSLALPDSSDAELLDESAQAASAICKKRAWLLTIAVGTLFLAFLHLVGTSPAGSGVSRLTWTVFAPPIMFVVLYILRSSDVVAIGDEMSRAVLARRYTDTGRKRSRDLIRRSQKMVFEP